MSARLEYALGEAWCIAAERVVLVCERDLVPERAAALHAEVAGIDSVEALQALLEAEPTALTGLIDLADRRVLLRRNGVPAAVGDSPMIDRFGADWARDETSAEDTLEAGALGSLAAGTLPLEGGVVQVAAVRVLPRRADRLEPEGAADDVAPAQPAAGAFGQTVPQAARAEAPVAATEPKPEPEPEVEPEAKLETVPELDPQPERQPEPEPETAREPREPQASAETRNPMGALIDSVPGFIRPAVDLHPLTAPEPADPGPAVPEPAAPVSVPAPAIDADGDHDGMTVTADQARALLAERQQSAAAVPPATGPLVLSTLCPVGHVNAPGSLRCHLCGEQIDEGSAAQRRRPEVAVAVLGSGERIPLGRGVVVGRRPRSRRVEDGRVPRLVTVESPGEDVSRSHVELRVEDWNLVAVDLSSTNGTLLLREGAAPQRLRPEASTILQLGDRLDLGDGVVITIEAAP